MVVALFERFRENHPVLELAVGHCRPREGTSERHMHRKGSTQLLRSQACSRSSMSLVPTIQAATRVFSLKNVVVVVSPKHNLWGAGHTPTGREGTTKLQTVESTGTTRVNTKAVQVTPSPRCGTHTTERTAALCLLDVDCAALRCVNVNRMGRGAGGWFMVGSARQRWAARSAPATRQVGGQCSGDERRGR